MENIIEKMQQRLSEARSRTETIRVAMSDLTAELDALAREEGELDAAIRIALRYSSHPQVPQPTEQLSISSVTTEKPQAVVGYGSKKATIVSFSRDAINASGALNSRRIIEQMDAAGLGDAVGGPDMSSRVKNLAAILSRDPHFVADRELGGWVYKESAAPQALNQKGRH